MCLQLHATAAQTLALEMLMDENDATAADTAGRIHKHVDGFLYSNQLLYAGNSFKNFRSVLSQSNSEVSFETTQC